MDGSSVSDAEVAAQIWAESQPHTPPAYLAYLHRRNLPFPATGLPPVAPGLEKILPLCKPPLRVERWGFEYFRFTCPTCQTSVFVPATQNGMDFIRRQARLHQVVRGTNPLTCCQQRTPLGPNVFPDSLEA